MSDAPSTPVLRIARPSDHLAAVATQYRLGLGLAELGRFEDHDGFDGIILGAPEHPWHLEFTSYRGSVDGEGAGRAPTEDNLLVLYLPDPAAFAARAAAVEAAGFRSVPAFNPYWDRDGVTFEDLDGYRLVLSRRAWER